MKNDKGDRMKVLVLLSGGVDSSTCIAILVEEHGKENVFALCASYGQKHTKELMSARTVADYYKIKLIEVDLTQIFSYSNSSLLSHSESEVPHGTYDEQLKDNKGGTVSTYVPFRNGLFLSVAASIALSMECEMIYYGAHSGDVVLNAYPDCSEAFGQAMNTAIYEGSGKKVKVVVPFVNISKSDIVKKGLELKVPYEITWSCYEGNDYSCGKCATCIERELAFEKNNAIDPLVTLRKN